MVRLSQAGSVGPRGALAACEAGAVAGGDNLFLTLVCRPEAKIREYFSAAAGGSPAASTEHSRLPAPLLDTFARWFPGLALSRTASKQPRCLTRWFLHVYRCPFCSKVRSSLTMRPLFHAMTLLLGRMRVLCFSNAGSAEDMYTNEGTGPRRAPSPLLVRPCSAWCCARMGAIADPASSSILPCRRSGVEQTVQSAWRCSCQAEI